MSYVDRFIMHWVIPDTNQEIIERIRQHDGWPGASLEIVLNGIDKNGSIFIRGVYHKRTLLHRTITAYLGTVPDDYRLLNLMMRHPTR